MSATRARRRSPPGWRASSIGCPPEPSQETLLALIDRLNADPAVDGILVQLPLPAHIDERRSSPRIDPDKDVDGFNPVNAGRLATGLLGFVPCTPLGCLMLLRDVRGDLAGLDAVVIGRSNIVGKPMAQLLLRRELHGDGRAFEDARPAATWCGAPTSSSRRWGAPGFVARRLDQARRDGDRRRDQPDRGGAGRRRRSASVADVAGAMTPVPGGVGPMTIAVLLRNTVVSAARREGVTLSQPL